LPIIPYASFMPKPNTLKALHFTDSNLQIIAYMKKVARHIFQYPD
jgi:hypothetical protein